MSNSKLLLLLLLELSMGQYLSLGEMEGGAWSGRKEGWRSFGRSRPLLHMDQVLRTRGVHTMTV
jgi:hypothetical protein